MKRRVLMVLAAITTAAATAALPANAWTGATRARMIGAAFKDDGTPRTPQSLDERSVPFAVASLAYSQAVNDIVRVWCRLWRASGGDMTGGKTSSPDAASPPVPAGR